MKPIDLRKLLKKHEGKWVAVKPFTNEVVATGSAPQEVTKKAKKKGVDKAAVFKARPINSLFAG